MDIKAGEVWYVKYPGATTLAKVEILDITEKTVNVEEQRIVGRSRPSRYERGDINFIEKAR